MRETNIKQLAKKNTNTFRVRKLLFFKSQQGLSPKFGPKRCSLPRWKPRFPRFHSLRFFILSFSHSPLLLSGTLRRAAFVPGIFCIALEPLDTVSCPFQNIFLEVYVKEKACVNRWKSERRHVRGKGKKEGSPAGGAGECSVQGVGAGGLTQYVTT